ncbi:DUF3301 domain-containing protein [Zestomonas carbonaria]|uniref:DUF3301 domain-containing protein n=1 Tax=Zestomonas carbonaria TaxID=2762745 RepID=A0A7U7EM16_9GAMM|nr:DUF3301 domain-containing protein [Pseudomonas carbonaria]CAD5107128.1 hypothetical protein PSEWESI4_01399 [Pseudomonas carbonaria]
MLTLGNLFVLMLLATAGAWLWHAHGLRERALELVKQHCARADVLLLDDNVALRRIALLPDARGRKRLARVYGFEFTVTGEQRHAGSIILFGRHLGGIELAPHPFDARAEADAPVPLEHPPVESNAKVISLNDWRRQHDQWNS